MEENALEVILTLFRVSDINVQVGTFVGRLIGGK